MTNEEFINIVIEYYEKARSLTYKNFNNQLIRGRSHSVSGKSEDLFAYWLADKLNDQNLKYYIDKSLSFYSEVISKTKAIQPDAFIIKDNIVTHYFDIKMDLGWKRDLIEYLNIKNFLIEEIKQKECWYSEGKKRNYLHFSQDIKYQIVVLSGENISLQKLEANINHASKLEHIELYVLTGNQHLNMYKKNQEREKLEIYNAAFDKLISDTKLIIN